MKARVVVTLKNGVLDPQGKAIEGRDKAAANASLQAACEKLLANTVIENFKIDLG